MKATFVKKADGFAEHAELFRLEKPAETRGGIKFEFIVVSTLECALDTGLPETYIYIYSLPTRGVRCLVG